MIILYKHYTKITNILLQTFSIFPLFLSCRFFFGKWFISNLQRKKYFFSCPRNLNYESNLKWAKNGQKKSTATQKEYLEIFLLLCILRKQKKNKASIWSKPELELQRRFTAETKKDIISWFWYIYLILTTKLYKWSTLEIIL